ncbi:hypothetical protein K5D50_10700 [Pseudomonas cichorii]|nr:hypothetical protein [Pseudomonas cichorii]
MAYANTKKRKTYAEKKEIVESAQEKTDAFLKARAEAIFTSVVNEEYKDRLPWNAPVFRTRFMNPASGTVYNIENSLLLSELTAEKGYDFPFFLTAAQGYAAKLSNKGETADFVVHRFGMSMGNAKTRDDSGQVVEILDENGKPKPVYRRACKLTPVFNLQQFTGELPTRLQKLIDAYAKTPTSAEVETVFQSLVDTMPTKLRRSNSAEGASNYYSPSLDFVNLAPSAQFKSRLQELSTLAHEVAHSYGHSSRKNRESLARYAEDPAFRGYEELVANLAAQAVLKHFNLRMTDEERSDLDDAFVANHNTYDVGWAARLSETPQKIFEAANDADRAASEMIFKIEQDLSLKLEANPALPVPEVFSVSQAVRSELAAKRESEPEQKQSNKKRNEVKI